MFQGGDLVLHTECEGFDSLRVHYMTEEKIEQLQKDLEQIAKLMVNVSGYLTELKYDLKKKQ